MIKKIISGGQTGADRAALDVAIELGIPHGGWIPKGRKTEDGRLPEKYRLQETNTIDYAQRTEFNVADSDGTLIFSHGKLKGGSALTRRLAKKHTRPCLHMDLDEISQYKAVEIIDSWIAVREIDILNVAGTRASEDPEIYTNVLDVLKSLFCPPPESMTPDLPHTLGESVDRLLSELSLKEKTMIANMTEDDLGHLHSDSCGDIVHTFRLQEGNEDLMRSCRTASGKNQLHPDDAAMIIVKELWKNLKETHLLRRVK